MSRRKRKQMWTDEEFFSLVKRKKEEMGFPLSDREVTKIIAKDYMTFEKWLREKRVRRKVF